VNFDLQASEINFDNLNRLLNPKFRNNSWSALRGKLLGGTESSSKLLQLDAAGRVTASRVIVKSLIANKFSAAIAIKDEVVEVRNIQAEMLGGHYTGVWSANFTGDEPLYAGLSTLDNAPVAQVNAFLHGVGGEGVIAHAALKLRLSGSDARTLTNTASGQLSFNWTDGALTLAATPEKSSTLAFSSWRGAAEISKGKVNLLSGWMQTTKGRTLATGSATFARELNLRLTDATQSISITGTLDAPVFQSETIPASALVESASNGKDAKPAKTP
jgi:AsmA-like protein